MYIKLTDLLYILKDDVRVEYFVRNEESGEFVRVFQGTSQMLREKRFVVKKASSAYVSYFSIAGDFMKGYTVCIGV